MAKPRAMDTPPEKHLYTSKILVIDHFCIFLHRFFTLRFWEMI